MYLHKNLCSKKCCICIQNIYEELKKYTLPETNLTPELELLNNIIFLSGYEYLFQLLINILDANTKCLSSLAWVKSKTLQTSNFSVTLFTAILPETNECRVIRQLLKTSKSKKV